MRTRLALPFLWLAACGDPGPDAVAGEQVYIANCVTCHGIDGDEQVASTLANGEPAAKLSEKVPEKTDEELKDGILNGVGEMPGVFLTEEEVANLVAYLRENF